MEKYKYMIPEDLVKYQGNVCRVTSTSWCNEYQDYLELDDNYDKFKLVEVEFIPITGFLLVDNGWLPNIIFVDKFNRKWTVFERKNYPDLRFCEDGYCYVAAFGNVELVSDIRYIHELQHLLYGLQLDNNLKIK